MGSDIRIEDSVIIIDCSRSMIKTDFEPDRLANAFETAKMFIQTKFIIDPKDRISILSNGKIPKRICPFTYDEEQLYQSFEKINISGKGNLHDGIAFAIQILVGEMRKVGGKISRIFIISDNRIGDRSENLNKIINIAKGLGIFIDTCQIGKTQDDQRSALKRIAQLTSAEFGFFNNSKALINSGKSFASKKAIKETNEFYSEKKKDKNPLVGEVALPLRRPSLLEVRMMISGDKIGQQKCAICHSIKAPLTGADFFTEGRSCPSCERAMHITCAAQWAKSSEFKEHVFRCPFCFFLLKVPKSALALIDEDKMDSKRIKLIADEKVTEMISIPDDEIEQIDASCSYCNNIFLGDFNVFQCSKCSAYYHEHCLEKMQSDIHACRYCGSKINCICR